MPLYHQAGTVVAMTEVEIDVGVLATRGARVTIVDASVTAVSKISVVQAGVAATGKASDENEMDALNLCAVPGAGVFDIIVSPDPGPIAGAFRVWYVVGT